jgi:TRAP-type C4-dicarboxylate transport system permease small subunit
MLVLIRALSLVTYRIAQVSILGTLAVVTGEVIARYVFNSPTQSSLEITEYFIVAMGFLPLAMIYRRRGHVSVDLLLDLLPSYVKWFCNKASAAITAVFSFLVFWFGMNMTMHAFESQTASSSLMAFPMWIAYLPIPLGFLALGCQAALDLLADHVNVEGAR